MEETNSLSCETIYSKLFYIILFSSSCFLLFFFLYSDIRRLLSIAPDDASYFLKTAQNFAAGKGITFDGINKTNGLQPLWFLVVSCLNYFFQGTPEYTYRLCFIIQLVFLISSSLIIYSIHSDFFSKAVRRSSYFMINSDQITLRKEDEAYKSPTYFNNFNRKKTVFIVWRLIIN